MTRVSLIIIGTELTEGIISDKHTPLVSREITRLGLKFSASVIVPDDGSVESAISALLPLSDIIITTGGLGPTSDDITRSSIASALSLSLIRDEEAWKYLEETLQERAKGSNERQAYIPSGFKIIPNPNGTAPGFYGEKGSVLFIALPGPPREMEPMFFSSVLPLIRTHLDIPLIPREEYSSFLTTEAHLDEYCDKANSELEWATRFQDTKISLYVSGKSKDVRDNAIKLLKKETGEYLLEEGNVSPLSLLVELLKANKATIGVAESCTGGLASSLLTSLPGASDYMEGSVTSYAISVKKHVLGVKDDTIEHFGAVSKKCAIEMAEGARKELMSDYAFSITGVAGPDKSEGKDVGTVCFGFSSKDRSEAITLHFGHLSRDSIRRRSTSAAFIMMRLFIEGKDLVSITKSWKEFI